MPFILVPRYTNIVPFDSELEIYFEPGEACWSGAVPIFLQAICIAGLSDYVRTCGVVDNECPLMPYEVD